MTAAASTEATPKWILDDLYLAQDDPKISEDLDRTAESAKSFAAQYQGKLAALDGAGLGRAIKEYEELSEVLSAVMSYAQLLFAADAENAQVAAFYQDMNERATEISTDTLFFELELNRIEDATLAQQMTDPTAVKYAPWVDSVRIYKPYQLDDELEKLLHEKSVTGRASWSRLFDETMAGMRFDVDGRKISSSEIMSRMSDADGLVRKKAAKAFGKGLNENIKLFSLVTNTLAKDKEIEDGWRKFPRPVSSRNLSNQVEDEVVDALASAVKDNYANLAHRYYKLKAKWMGVEEMDYWDRCRMRMRLKFPGERRRRRCSALTTPLSLN